MMGIASSARFRRESQRARPAYSSTKQNRATAVGIVQTATTNLFQKIFVGTSIAAISNAALTAHNAPNKNAMERGSAPGTLRRRQAYIPKANADTAVANIGQI